MDELTRFARRLVERLGVRPDGVHRPVSLEELREKILPYRAHRRALGLESVEDYETVILRLAAEERGYVKTVPPGTAARCREELAQPNPDLGILDELAGSTVQITSMAAAQIVADEGRGDPPPAAPARVDAQSSAPERSAASSPPNVAPAPAAPARDDRRAPPARDEGASTPARTFAVPPNPIPEPRMPFKPVVTSASSQCVACQRPLPTDRQVVFCPWCGERLIPFVCERCKAQLDSTWKHCIRCGAPVKDPFHFG